MNGLECVGVCMRVCVCVQGWISPPSLFLLLFLFILSTRFNRCVFNRPGCCAGCPTKGGLPGPQPRCPHRSGRCLAPFWLPLGVTKTTQRNLPYSCSAPPQTPAAAPPAPPSLPLFLFHCFNKKMKYILHFFVYYLFLYIKKENDKKTK